MISIHMGIFNLYSLFIAAAGTSGIVTDAKKNHYEQLVELDNKFHESIYRASGSKILEHELTTFHHYLERIRKESLKKEERAQQSNEEHQAILEAIRDRDGDLAEKLAHEHIIQTIENMNKAGL